MNILFNKKILFSLLLSSSLLTQGAYAQNDPSTEISGTLSILPTSSLDTPVLDIPASGSVTVGNHDPNNKGYLYIKDSENGNAHTTESNIAGTLTVNQDGEVLNEETIKCTGTISNKDTSTPALGGLFVNQGTIEILNGATLTCKNFPDGQNTGGIMNGCCPFDKTKTPTFTYGTSGHEHEITQDNPGSDSKYTGNSGTITFIPGAVCNDGGDTPSYGEIDGGTIDLTKYVKIIFNSNKYSLDFDSDTTENWEAKNAQNDSNTRTLKINLKNAKIKLFTGGDTANDIDGATTGTKELSELKLESLEESGDGNYLMNNMFANLTFENCICEIPRDSGSGTVAYEFKNADNTSTLNENQATELKYKPIAFNADAANRYKVGSSGSGGSDNNFNIVKQLFNSNGNASTPIYHGLGELDNSDGTFANYTNYDCTTTINKTDFSGKTDAQKGLVLYGSGNGDLNGNKKTFSQLFNDYMDLNCYIDTNESTKAYSNDVSPLPLKLKPTLITGNTISSDIFIQTSGNTPIQIDKMYTDGNNDASIDKPLELVMKNPWIHTETRIDDDHKNPVTYTGTLSRTLPNNPSPNQKTTRIVQEYAGPAFDKYKSNVGVSGNIGINGVSGHEILEYEVNCNCGVKDGGDKLADESTPVSQDNFNTTKFSTGSSSTPLAFDKFSVGNNSDVFVRSEDDNTNKYTRITTQQFQVGSGTSTNTKFELNGHITVKNLTGSDFGV